MLDVIAFCEADEEALATDARILFAVPLGSELKTIGDFNTHMSHFTKDFNEKFELNYSDYAGSGIVHMAGAAAALAGVCALIRTARPPGEVAAGRCRRRPA